MTDREIDAIDNVRYMIEKASLNNRTKIEFDIGSIMYQNIQTVLNLIQTQQEEIENKDKIIDEMANWIDDRCYYSDNYGNSCEIIQDSCYNNENCNKCIKEYFINKAEKEN